MTNKPKVLVLGGCGFIGRHLVHYLISNDLVSEIRVVDKTPPQMAWLNADHANAFDDPKVEFCSANLINQVSCKNAFASANEQDWDYVFNCAAENRPGQSDAVYNEGIFKLSQNCANASAIHRVKRYVEFSSGNMCSSDHTPISDECVQKPWTFVARNKAKVEQELNNMASELNYTILRLPVVYGLGDRRGFTPRVVIAALYKHLGETMKLLWSESLKLNTVHVSDVVAAAYELAIDPRANKQHYNIVDDSQSTQGTLSSVLADIFDIKVDYWGIAMSSITKIKMDEVVEEINDKHMGPWLEICQKDGIENTPLTPYMDEELLFHKHLNLDNGKLKQAGYVLRVPTVKRESIEEIILDFTNQGLFPRSLGF